MTGILISGCKFTVRSSLISILFVSLVHSTEEFRVQFEFHTPGHRFFYSVFQAYVTHARVEGWELRLKVEVER